MNGYKESSEDDETSITFPINLPDLTGREALALVTILDHLSRQIWQTFEIEMTLAILKQEGVQAELSPEDDKDPNIDFDQLF